MFCTLRANSRWLLFQVDKFSITANQIPGTQARHPEKPTAHVWKLFCLHGKPTGKAGAAKSNSPAAWGMKLPLPLGITICLVHITSQLHPWWMNLGDGPWPELAVNDGTIVHRPSAARWARHFYNSRVLCQHTDRAGLRREVVNV